jgi:hypothetical protein
MDTPLPGKPKKSFLRRMGRVLLFMLAGLLFLLGGLLTLLFVYEKEVKTAIITGLNKYLRAEVKVAPADIDLTIIKTFPHCSIEFRNILIKEALKSGKRDTLLFAERLNLLFNVSDLWDKRYGIEELRLYRGVLRPKILKNGKNNFTIWESAGNTKNESLDFDLQLVRLEKFAVTYRDEPSRFRTEVFIDDLSLKGNFNSQDYRLDSEGDLRIISITSGRNTFLRQKDLSFATSLQVHGDDYLINKADLSLGEMALKLKGRFRYADSLRAAEIGFDAPGLDIGSLLSLLPSEFRNRIGDYNSSGNFFANGRFELKDGRNHLSCRFGISDGEIVYKPTAAKATGVNLAGTLDYSDRSSSLALEQVRLSLNGDEVKGHFKLTDFSDPYIELNAGTEMDLRNLHNFWPIDTISDLSGQLKLLTDVKGRTSDFEKRPLPESVALSLNATVKDLVVKFLHDEREYRVEGCQLSVNEGEVQVKDLSLKRGGSDFRINGRVPGLLTYIFDRSAPLNISGSLFAGTVNMEDFLGNSGNEAATSAGPLIPANLNLKVDAQIDRFTFGKFAATAITGDLEIRKKKAMVDNMRFSTMDGSGTVSALADNRGEGIALNMDADLSHINITELFRQMNNFGQSTLTDANLKGFATAHVDFSGNWSNALVSDPASLRCASELKIEKGELAGFQPLMKLSRYLDVQDFQRIRFATLQGHVDIRDQVIAIRKTTINNSALNIDFWGTHTFDNDIDYHFRMLMSEVMARKFRRQEEFGPERDPHNRRSLHIVMSGNIDNPVFRYDRQGMKEKIKEDIREEKQNMRHLLKEEFGLFRKDTLPPPKKKEPEVFTFEKTGPPPPKKTLEPKKRPEEEDF